MNPFDLPGPPFLLFYVVLVVAAQLLWRPLARFFVAPSPSARPPVDRFNLQNLDPYLVAHLRGREAETARVAIVSLLDRGLLVANEEKLGAKAGSSSHVRRPLEREILRFFATPSAATGIFRDDGFKRACHGLHEELVKLGLVPDANGAVWLVLLRLGMLALQAGVAIAKINIALGRGHRNIGFLVVLSIAAAIVTSVRSHPKRTRWGDDLLDDLQVRYTSLEDRGQSSRSGGGSHELVLLAAVFGLAALPAVALAQATTLFPLSMGRTGASGSCGSSCGTSCSSSCGSSCGGGCGGGCGGCG